MINNKINFEKVYTTFKVQTSFKALNQYQTFISYNASSKIKWGMYRYFWNIVIIWQSWVKLWK
jgi:hypothetical protein